jgi:hypothetical protein
MNALPVVIIAIACYTAGMIHGRWQVLSQVEIYFNQIQPNFEKNERTLDRKVPPANFI